MKPQSATALLFGLLLFLATFPPHALAQANAERGMNLENRVSNLEQKFPVRADEGVAVFLFGAFCALWAQNTGRNPWLWFFLGMFFNVITVLVLLSKNSKDKLRSRDTPS